MPNKELGDFLLEQCKQRRLSLRRLSINSGLSPATVYNIIKRQYQPTLFSLNRLADYLGVKRQYLWQMAGLLEDMDYDAKTAFGDPQLRFQFARVDKLPEAARNMIISVIKEIIIFLETGNAVKEDKDIPNTSSCQRLAENSGLPAQKVLAIAGHLPKMPEAAPPEWPEFREYARQKYPDELDEDLITMIEDLIERRRQRRYGRKDS